MQLWNPVVLTGCLLSTFTKGKRETMGMRCTQFIGLPAIALEFLNKNASSRRKIILIENENGKMQIQMDGKETLLPHSEVYAYAGGMFADDECPLHKYFVDGQWWYEKVQFSVWSSGPVIATKLVSENEDTYEWAYEDYSKFL